MLPHFIIPQAGLVYAVATEDMDALTFGTPRLLRNLMASQSQNLNVSEFDLSKALEVRGGGGRRKGGRCEGGHIHMELDLKHGLQGARRGGQGGARLILCRTSPGARGP